MTREETIHTITNYFGRYAIRQLGLFGSFARKEDKKTSDIDILVDFKETIDLFELVNITQELSALLGRKVDVITTKSLYPALKQSIQNDLIIIAEA